MPSSDGSADERVSPPRPGTSIEHVLPLLYDELRALAGALMRHERPDHTLQATALVHEAYLRLASQRRLDPHDRAQVMAAAARVMRRVLVDHARARGRLKRGGRRLRLTLSDDLALAPGIDLDLLALDDALQRLAQVSVADHAVIELRFFGGLSLLEIAQVQGSSERTVRRRYAFARAWLWRELGREAALP